MIGIGSTEFSFSSEKKSKSKMEEYTIFLFDQWDEYIGKSLIIPDYSLSLEIEEGSIKGLGKIAATAAALYFGIGQYGSFVSGIETIIGQARSVGNYLVEKAETLGDSKGSLKVKRRSETLGSLERLFHDVQNGKISAEEATSKAKSLLGDESPELIHSLEQEFKTLPLHPQQIEINFHDPIFSEEKKIEKTKKPIQPRLPTPPVVPSKNLRVEIWRESKKQHKKIRTTLV